MKRGGDFEPDRYECAKGGGKTIKFQGPGTDSILRKGEETS